MGVQFELNNPGVLPPLESGDPIPWLVVASDVRPDFRISTMGGRRCIMIFVDSLTSASGLSASLRLLDEARNVRPFSSAFVLVSRDRADIGWSPPEDLSIVRCFFDPDGEISKTFGVPVKGTLWTIVVDERLRVLSVETSPDVNHHLDRAVKAFWTSPQVTEATNAPPQAPVLLIPRVFDQALCARLIDGFHRHGGEDSGFMVEANGLTVPKFDYSHKRRTDWLIDDDDLVQRCHNAIKRRILPEVRRAFQFEASRIERNLVACYDSSVGGHFNRHRDNTTRGTAHRRFAMSLNLNTEDFEGGELVFPEFGPTKYRPETGGACVFSCSLMHEAHPVRRGQRYVFVPFFYDEAAKLVREDNLRFMGGAELKKSED